MTAASSSRSTAATRRPTSRSCARTARCSRSCAGRLSSPHHIGARRLASTLLGGLLDEAARRRPDARRRRRSTVAQLLLAGLDFPAEERELHAAVAARGWAAAHRRRQRHVRGAARRHRARLGRRGRLRRRDQLRRRRARRPPRALPRARRDHRRLGRRLRPRAGGALGRGAQRGRARADDELERAVPAHFGLRHAARAGRGDPPRRHPERRAGRAARRVVFEAGRRDAGRGRDRRAAGRRGRRARARRDRAPGARRRPSRSCSAAGSCRPATGACCDAIEPACAGSAPRSRSARCRRRRSSAPRCSRSTTSAPTPEAQARCARELVGHAPSGRGTEAASMAEVRFDHATRIYPGTDVPGRRRARPHIEDGEFMVLVGPRARARRPRCGCSPGSRRSMPARSGSATAT